MCSSQKKRETSILYYPNGHDSGNADYIAVLLQLQPDASASDDPPAAAAAPTVRARARFSLLDQDGKPVPSHTQTTSLKEFSAVVPGRSFGFGLVRRDFLEKSQHLRDDCFRISCDVIIPGVLRAEDRSTRSARTPPPLVAVPPPDLNRHLGGLLAAEHGLPGEEKLCNHIDTGSLATILALAEQHNCWGLKKACFRFISSPSTLKDVLATDGFQHLAHVPVTCC